MPVPADWELVELIISEKRATSFVELAEIVERLRKRKDYRPAGRLLKYMTEIELDEAQRLWVYQKLAMVHYHDGEYAKGSQLERALLILEEGMPLEVAVQPPPSNSKAEHLAIAGAIYKRRFDVSGRSQDLNKAMEYYDGAVTQSLHDQDAPAGARRFSDGGYAAINAAFVRDLLAHVERPSNSSFLYEEADELRTEIVSQLEPELERVRATVAAGEKPGRCDWWTVVTYAEAKLGMGDVRTARDAVLLFPPDVLEELGDWERETTARQLARLTDVRADRVGDRAHEVATLLAHIAQCDHPSYATSLRAQFGLALSGGGFRASFFHLGVLARLAELDLLRHVGVLSCVSGGSIVGAHYYLALQQILESTPDSRMSRQTYVDLVHHVIESFRAGVDCSLRNGAFADPRNLIRKLRSRFGREDEFSRTTRAGELLDRYFYDPVAKEPSIQPRPLRELLVTPKGETSFNPKRHNWRRAAKVPMFVINATTLNNGNNWQFTATWVGEPDSDFYGILDDLSHNDRMYLADEVPEGHRDLPLRSAVGASAAVPGVFAPISLKGLVPSSGSVIRLVDGGVQDNQGVGGLIDEDCTHIFISDASGQLRQAEEPPSNSVQVLMRSSSIQRRTIRTGVFQDVEELKKSSRLNRAWTVHLTKGLAEWDGDDPDERTDYGIPVRIQSKLAQLRTDLDRFSEREAFALMLSGYRMANRVLEDDPPPLLMSSDREPSWPFLELESVIGEPGSTEYLDLTRELDLGQHVTFRGIRRRLPGYDQRIEV